MSVKVAHIFNHDIGLRVHARNYFSYLQKQGYDLYAVCSPGEYVKGDMVTREGVTVKAINFPPQYTPVHDFKALVQLVHYFRQQKFDIVHTHTVKPGLLGRVAAWLAGVPIVIHTVHGFHIWDDMTAFEQRLFGWVERFAARFCDLLLSQNREDMEVAVRSHICSADRIHYLGNGIDISYFCSDQISADQIARLRQEVGVTPDEHLVGMIGRMVRLKGYYDYLEAARILKSRGEPIKFLAIGPTMPEKSDALSPDELIAQYGLTDTLQYLGQRSDVRELIAAMDVLVLASYAEGIPRVLMEAAAMGKAAVGTDVRGTREVIIDGETGYLVEPRNPAALADGIVRLLSDRQRAQDMGAAARRRAETHFDERRFFWRTDVEYRRLLEEKRLAPKTQGLKPLSLEALKSELA
jgi:glycosyltransferase involved in cell wall biosynthesis